MSTTVATSFIQLYDPEVKIAYQRMGSLLRQTVRTRTVPGERIYFPKLGKGVATTKARHADVVPMNLEHTRVFADMSDFYAPEYIDELDMSKINWSLRQDYARSAAMALGRQTDDLILTAMNGATNTFSATTINAAATPAITGSILSLPVVTEMSKQLNSRDVPTDGERYAVIGPTELQELLQIVGATSSDFSSQQLLMTGQAPVQWMGFRWIMHSGLPSGVKGFFYHRSAVGHGIAKDVTSRVDWVPQKAAWLVNAMMSMGSVLIDNNGILELNA